MSRSSLISFFLAGSMASVSKVLGCSNTTWLHADRVYPPSLHWWVEMLVKSFRCRFLAMTARPCRRTRGR
uniref:Secreted protein n=1 Tax=Arundo donax TaxID=35708 RepID=A0A0A9G2L1_ARUDO